MDVDREALRRTYSEKSDSVLLDLHAAGDLTDVAYEVIEDQLSKRGLDVPPRPEPTPEEKSRFTVGEFWDGKATLTEAFWGVWVFGGVMAVVAQIVVGNVLLLLTGGSEAVLVVPYAGWLAWVAFASVSVWRCAFNTRRKVWGYVVRGIVAVAVLVNFTQLVFDVGELIG